MPKYNLYEDKNKFIDIYFVNQGGRNNSDGDYGNKKSSSSPSDPELDKMVYELLKKDDNFDFDQYQLDEATKLSMGRDDGSGTGHSRDSDDEQSNEESESRSDFVSEEAANRAGNYDGEKKKASDEEEEEEEENECTHSKNFQCMNCLKKGKGKKIVKIGKGDKNIFGFGNN